MRFIYVIKCVRVLTGSGKCLDVRLRHMIESLNYLVLIVMGAISPLRFGITIVAPKCLAMEGFSVIKKEKVSTIQFLGLFFFFLI